jgi:MoaA/NifB/PqqE/SkfB family radical SAM enzyme
MSLADVGVSYVGISIEACKAAGLKVELRFTLTRANQEDLPWLFYLMEERNVPRLCIYHLAPTGRGAKLKSFAPAAEEI